MKKKKAFLLWLIFLAFLGIFLFNFKSIKNDFVNTFLSKYIEAKDSYLLFKGDEKLLASPVSEKCFGVAVSEDNPAIIELPFSQLVNLGGFSVYFYGNLHSVSSYLAEDFEVYYKNDNHQWSLVDKIQGNNPLTILLK